MATAVSIELSDPFGNVSGASFNDYDIASKGKKKISQISLYKSGSNVVGIKTTYIPKDEKSHGDVSGDSPTVITLDDDQHIIAAFVVTSRTHEILGVFFNVANTKGMVEKKGIDADDPPRGYTVERAFGHIIAFHGTATDDTLTSLGFQVLQSR